MNDRWDEFDDVIRTLGVQSARLRAQGCEYLSDQLFDAVKLVKGVADAMDFAWLDEFVWALVEERGNVSYRVLRTLVEEAGHSPPYGAITSSLSRLTARGLLTVKYADGKPTLIEVNHECAATATTA